MRVVGEVASEYGSQWAAIVSIAAKIGCTPETLRRWVRQQERDTGQRPGPTTAAGERGQGAGTRSARAAQGQREPASGECFFRLGGARPPLQAVRAFIDQYRHAYGVEPICRVMQVAPSGYWRYAAQQRNPALRLPTIYSSWEVSVCSRYSKPAMRRGRRIRRPGPWCKAATTRSSVT